MRLLSFTAIAVLTGLTGCQRDPEPVPVMYNVTAAVEPYVQRFRNEAQQRNVAIVSNDLIVEFGPTQGEDVCGECRLQPGKTPRITLNTNSFCWQNASAEEREGLVFHELGHCLLKRDHRSDRFPNRAFVSLMNPGDVRVYATCAYPIGDDVCDKRPRRPYYVDELFNPGTPAPAWGK